MEDVLSAGLQVEEEVLDEAPSIRRTSALDQGQTANEEEPSVRLLSERENDQRVSEEVVSAMRSSAEDQGEPSDEEMPPLRFSAIEENGPSSTTSPHRSHPADSLDDLGDLPGEQDFPSVNPSSSGEQDQSPTTSPRAAVNDGLSEEECRSESPQMRWSDLLIPRPPEEVFNEHLNESDGVIVADGRNKHFLMIHDVMFYSHRCVVPVVLDLTELRPEWREYIGRRVPNVPFPQLWLLGECRGSLSDVVALYKSKELHDLLREVVRLNAERSQARLNRAREAKAKATAAAGGKVKPMDEEPVEQPISSSAIRRSPLNPLSLEDALDYDRPPSTDPIADSPMKDFAYEDSAQPSSSVQVPGSSVQGTAEEEEPLPDTVNELSAENDLPVTDTAMEQSAEEELKSVLENSDAVIMTKGQGKPFLLMLDAVNCAYDGSPKIIDISAKGVEWREAAVRVSAGVSFPQLWITGECKGSLNDVIALNSAGHLKDILRDAGGHGDR